MQGAKVDATVLAAGKFELVDGLLYRKVFDTVAEEVQLRCCAPSGSTVCREVPGVGERPLPFRE